MMERIIKFRAWNGKNMMPWEKCLQHFELCDLDKEKKSVIDIDFMQSTEIEDKNKNIIYEGDICKVMTWRENPDIWRVHSNLFKVTWDEENAKFELYSPDELWGEGVQTDEYIETFIDFNPDEQVIEIIGNIYENPELMK